MVLGKYSVPKRPTNLDNTRARVIALAAGAGGVVWTFFSLVYLSLFGRGLDID